jgi:hypothetical protein
MRTAFTLLFGILGLLIVSQTADARDGCGPGYYFNGYRCRPMEREFGPYVEPPRYREPYYERREYGPPRGMGPGGWHAIRGENSQGRPEIWYVPQAGRCPQGFTIQDGVCKRYRGY